MKSILSFLALAALTLGAHAAPERILTNVDKAGLALQGHDPVAFFTEGKPVKGNPDHSSTRPGAIYHFASAANKAAFDAAPEKYEPQFGGYCAYGVARGSLAPIRPEAFQIVNGRLLLQYDLSIRRHFNKDAAGELRKADEKWPALLAEKGKSAR
jgi:YHS domain-containing protein